jgi:hypothetical protein
MINALLLPPLEPHFADPAQVLISLLERTLAICRKELGRLIGFAGRAARGVAWELVVPAYVAGGVVVVTSGLFSQLDFKWTQIQAAGGTFGLTFWLLLLPLWIPEAATHDAQQQPCVVPRSIGWIVAGVLCALVFIGVLGPGISV